MPTLGELLEFFPKRLAAIAAALAAASAIVFPAALIPDNVAIVGTVGSLLVLIVFLVVWAFHKELRQWRKPVFLVVGLLCVVALWKIVRLHQIAVEPVPAIGNPPRAAQYLVGTELTARGLEWDRMLGHPSRSTFIVSIGPDDIPAAWGQSYDRKASEYAAAYLTLASGLLLMIGISEFARPRQREPRD